MTPAEAYKLTWREIAVYADGRRAAELQETKRRIDMAWLNAMLHKTDPKKFPQKPDEFYPREPLTPKQRAEQNAARMRAFRDARNASLKTKKIAEAPPVVRRKKKEK